MTSVAWVAASVWRQRGRWRQERHGKADIEGVCIVEAITVVGQIVEDLSRSDLVVVGVQVPKLDEPRLLHNSDNESACLSISNINEDGPSLLGLEYALLFAHVLFFCVGGRVGVLIFGFYVFKVVKGMAEEGGLFGIRSNKPGEAVLLPMVVKTTEEFNDGASDAFDIGVGRRSYYRLKDGSGGGKGG